MANQTLAPSGIGYGSLIWDEFGVQSGDLNNVYLDSLIWGVGWTDGNLNDPISASQSDPVSISYNILNAHDAASWWNDPRTTTAEDFYDPVSSDFILASQVLNHFEEVTNLEFNLVSGIADTNIVLTTDSWVHMNGALGWAEVPDTTYYNTGVFINAEAAYYFGDGEFYQGSFNYVTLLHEIGHNMGLAHPHDGGDMPDASLFPGVVSPFDSYGDNAQNQGIYTTMSYNSGFALNPSPSYNYGYEGTLMAYDIAALQHLYGVNTETRTGDDVYLLPTSNGIGTYYSCIWDAGGTDTISNEGAVGDCDINLSYASLQYGDLNGGGTLSFANDSLGNFIHGGYTIANGVLIENAVGGDGHDEIVGNFLNNNLIGNSGNDIFIGLSGDDYIDGGANSDTAVFNDDIANAFIKKDKASGGYLIQTDADGSDTLVNIEFVKFSNLIEYSLDTLYADRVDPTINMNVDGANQTIVLEKYLGNVEWIDTQYYASNSNEVIYLTDYNDFFNALDGADAINGRGGDDVIDGGLGSNFLSGGTGGDTFFVDGRGASLGQITWSTILDFESADDVNIWGWQSGTSSLVRIDPSNGAVGYEGVTYHYDLDGNSVIDTSITFTGISESQIADPTYEVVASNEYVKFDDVLV